MLNPLSHRSSRVHETFLATHRPVIVIEVLNHRGRDHGDNVAAVMREHGYFYYACSTYSDWEPHATIVGDKQEARNWLLSPVPLSRQISRNGSRCGKPFCQRVIEITTS